MILLAAALALGQTANPAPLIYPAAPMIRPVQAAQKRLADIEVDFHTVSVEIGEKDAKFSMVTLYKNRSEIATDAEISLPVLFANGNASATMPWSVKWGDKDPGAPIQRVILEPQPGAAVAPPELRTVYRVSFPAYGQKSLKTELTVPIQVLGEGEMERRIAYRLRTMAGLHKFNFSVKYDPQKVFRVIHNSPDNWPWQVSNKGAFVTLTTPEMNKESTLVFHWYRGGFGKVGDGKVGG